MAVPLAKNLSGNVLKISCNCGRRRIYFNSYNSSRLLIPIKYTQTCQQNMSTDTSGQPVSNASAKGQKISQAMKAYLERAQAHEKMMSAEIAEYEVGRRHLANIMGEDPDTFTQEHIDKAIEYLLPSSLFDKKARPLMKHPTEALPTRKAAAFSADGRPFHSLFYTNKPNFYRIMFDAGLKLDQLQKMEDANDIKTKEETDASKVFLAGSKWIEKKHLEQMTQEKISVNDHTRLMRLLERLAHQPYSKQEEEFIFSFRKILTAQSMLDELKPELYDSSGKAYQEAEGQRKSALAKVTVYRRGTGQFTVNGKDLLAHFPKALDRQQLLFPLQFVNLVGEVDVFSTVEKGGDSSQAGAVRLALSRALQTFVDKEMLDKMRLAGLLTPDPRVRERKKFGQEGARRKYTWKKR